MAMNPVLALINCDSEDKFVRDVVEAYFQNPIHVRDLLTEDCIEACLDDYMRNQDVIADVRDQQSDCNNEAKLSAKQRRAARRVQNKRHKSADRAHGKKRPMSRKDAVRANDDRAQMTRPIGMWSLYPNGACHFRPFQRSNRHNNHLSYGQEVLNMLKVASKRVTAEDVNWAKAVVQNAAEEGQEWAIHDYLAEQLDYCPTPEKEVALLTVILLSWWTEQFDGYISCGLPATEDCFNSISHSNWYKWAVKQEVPLMVEAWKQA